MANTKKKPSIKKAEEEAKRAKIKDLSCTYNNGAVKIVGIE